MASFRHTMASLHTWTGILAVWLLYFIFITGAIGYFDSEIDRWMQPELPPAAHSYSATEVIRSAQNYLQNTAPYAERWVIFLPINRHEPYPRLFWHGTDPQGNKVKQSVLFDNKNAQPFAPRKTAGAQTLYKMHWKLHYVPRLLAELIVSVASMFMLLALITGIIIHRHIFKDFFTFRRAKKRRSWLDAHNLISVTTLPFQLMITYSGLVFVMFSNMPLILGIFYGLDAEGSKRFKQETTAISNAPSPYTSELIDLTTVLPQVEKVWGQDDIRLLDVRYPGNLNAQVIVAADNTQQLSRGSSKLIFNGVNGSLIALHPADPSTGQGTRNILLGLHEGLFAPPLLRWLYFLSGMLGAMMIATGALLWEKKRRQRLPAQDPSTSYGLIMIEQGNVAALLGLPVAIAAYFWANRLFPLDIDNRADWECHILFMTWLGCFIHAFARPRLSAWFEQSCLACVMFAALPIINAFTTERHLLKTLPEQDWSFAGFDLSMLVIALIAAAIAMRVYQAAKPSASLRLLPPSKRSPQQGVS